MGQVQFPKIQYRTSMVRNRNQVLDEQASSGQKAADRVASIVGSWRFIIIQSVLLMFWVLLNISGWVFKWDPYPFILMNLVLSTQAAFTAPIIMMSQNRQAERDRLESHMDFEIDRQAEEEIRAIKEQLEAQNQALLHIHQLLLDLHTSKKEAE
ncbi:MAG: hypothetical protein CL610_14585 [Anaerolineaceae bacterium]|nr:hypothetical protein [Anaerolineaceae bacterium]